MTTQPTPGTPTTSQGDHTRTHRAHIGPSYEYLCQHGGTFIYSHTPFGKIIWHRGQKDTP